MDCSDIAKAFISHFDKKGPVSLLRLLIDSGLQRNCKNFDKLDDIFRVDMAIMDRARYSDFADIRGKLFPVIPSPRPTTESKMGLSCNDLTHHIYWEFRDANTSTIMNILLNEAQSKNCTELDEFREVHRRDKAILGNDNYRVFERTRRRQFVDLLSHYF